MYNVVLCVFSSLLNFGVRHKYALLSVSGVVLGIMGERAHIKNIMLLLYALCRCCSSDHMDGPVESLSSSYSQSFHSAIHTLSGQPSPNIYPLFSLYIFFHVFFYYYTIYALKKIKYIKVRWSLHRWVHLG